MEIIYTVVRIGRNGNSDILYSGSDKREAMNTREYDMLHSDPPDYEGIFRWELLETPFEYWN